MRKFLVGTDWWTDCDDAVALRLLVRAARAGEIVLKGIGINACMEHSVASLDGFLCLEGLDKVPLGIDPQATDFGGTPRYQASLVPYAKHYAKNTDAEDFVSLYRRVLAESPDPVELVEIGYPQALVAVLESGADAISPKSGLELVREKVPKIWMMAGKWDRNEEKENNFARNTRSRKAGAQFCHLCPVPVTFLGWEVGNTVITGNTLRRDDHLYRVLCDHGSPNGRMSWDPMLVLLALIGDEERAGYHSICGRASVDAVTGANSFVPMSNGIHRYVVKQRDDTFYADAINSRIE